MQVKSNKSENYSLRRLVADKSQITSVMISVDLNHDSSSVFDATLKLYPEMLMSGTKNLTRDQFIDRLKLIGANLSVNVTNRTLTFELTSQTKDFNKLLYLFTQMISAPKFAKTELDRVKKVTHNELEQDKENSKSIALAELRNQLYKPNNRLYCRTAKELQTDIPKITSKDLNQLHKTVKASFWKITVLGNSLVQTATEKSVTKLIKADTKTPNTSEKTSTNKPKQALKLIDVPSKSNIDLSIGMLVPLHLDDDELVALNFGISVLAKWGGFAGRLMGTVREKEGLTYGIYGKVENATTSNYGYFRIMTFFSPDKVCTGLISTFRELKLILSKGITDDELTRFKNINSTQHKLMYDSIVSQHKILHGLHLNDLSVDYLEETLAKINKLTKKEVNETLKKYLKLENIVVSGAGPVRTVEKEVKKVVASVS